jgi:hypothetical protein
MDALQAIVNTLRTIEKRVARVERVEVTPRLILKNAACRVYRNTTQSISSSTWTAIQFNTERFNTGGMWVSGSNTRITFAVAGRYVVSGGVTFASNSTGVRDVAFYLNGANDIAYDRRGSPGAVDLQVSLSTIYEFAAGDYIEMRAWQNSGVSINAQSYARYSPELAVALLHTNG